jgi:hypothetical protein
VEITNIWARLNQALLDIGQVWEWLHAHLKLYTQLTGREKMTKLKYVSSLVIGVFFIANSISATALPNADTAVTNSNVKALFTAIATSDPDKLAIAQKYISQNSSADLAVTMIQNSLSGDKYWRSLKPFSVQSTGLAVSNPAKGTVKFNKNSITLKSSVIAFNGIYSNFKLDSKGKVKSWSVTKNASATKLSLDEIIYAMAGKIDDDESAELMKYVNGTTYQSPNGNTYIQVLTKNTSGSPKSIYFTGGKYRSADGKTLNATTLPGGCFSHDQIVVIDANLTGKANIVKNTQGILELPTNHTCDAPWQEDRLELRLTAN